MAGALDVMAQEMSQGHRDAQTFPWEKLTYAHVQLLRASLAKRYAPATANKMLAALRGVLKECWRLGKISVEELHRACDVRPVKGSRTPKGRALSNEELYLLSWHCGSHRNRALIALLAGTGLRRAEACALTWGDLVDAQPLSFLHVRGKGGKLRIVPVPASVEHCLVSSLKVGQCEDRIFRGSPGNIWTMLRQASFAAGISPVSPHDLRRTYATNLLAGGVSLPRVQALMGHASPKTTAAYDRSTLVAVSEDVKRVIP